MSTPNLPIAVLISGGGTTLRNLLEKIAAGSLPAQVKLVISSNPSAAGLQIAQAAGVPTLVIEKSKGEASDAYSRAIFGPCEAAGVKLVVMGGFLKHVLIPPTWENRVINTHPSLIPAFCGKGMYGSHVHQAVLDYGAKLTGCTIHFVDNQYDHGPIILQRSVPVENSDTAQTLAARVFAQECAALPEAIRLFAEGRVRVEGRRVRTHFL